MIRDLAVSRIDIASKINPVVSVHTKQSEQPLSAGPCELIQWEGSVDFSMMFP